jgi:predicted double-glycine peptidase
MFSITIPRFRLFLKRKKLNSHNAKKPYRVGIKRATVYKFYWVIIALFAPEFVFYAALSQWKEASALREALQEIHVEGNNGKPQPPDEQVPGTDDGEPQPPDEQVPGTGDGEPQPPDEQVPGTDGGSTPLVRVGVDIPPKDAIADGDGLEEVPRADGESLVEGDAIESAEQEERRALELLKPTLSYSAEKKDWSSMSMTSAFFVIMGGYAYRRGYDFKIPESDLKFPHLMLTSKGFLELAKEGVLHPGILDDKAITDRSKADWLAKLLVCAQAFWMVFNVIARKASGLPSTLIELNVIVHVVVMVVVYGLWWDKPLAVQNPIILNPSPKYIDEHTTILSILECNFWDRGSEAKILCYQILVLHKDDVPLKKVYWFDHWMTESSTRREIFKHNHPRLFWFYRRFSCDRGDYQNHPISLRTAEEHHQRYSGISIPEGLKWKYFVVAEIDSNSDRNKGKEARRTAAKDLDVNVKDCSKGLLLLPGQVLLSENAENHTYAAVTRYRRPVFLTEHQMRFIEQDGAKFHSYLPQNFICRWSTSDTSNITFRSPWLQGIKSSKWCPAPVLTIGGPILSLIYAGCHATAWNSHFPSFTERYLWRGACIVIAAGGPTFLVSNAIHHIVKAYGDALNDYFLRELRKSHPFPCGLPRYIFYRLLEYMYTAVDVFYRFLEYVHTEVDVFMYACMLLYTLARIFIIVEAFISIRSLPAGAYDSVDWIEMLPHV